MPDRFAALVLPLYLVAAWTAHAVERTCRYLGHSSPHGRSCPGCGRYVSRRAGDWILTCHRCGWRAGWPGLRWVTRSLPARQLRDEISGLGVVAGAVAIVLVAGVSIPAVAVPALPNVTAPAVPNVSGDVSEVGDSNNTTSEPLQLASESYDHEEIERRFLIYLNRAREQRGLQPVSRSERLTPLAETHAENMAEHDYIGHDQPGPGGDIQDRYESYGLLPDCRLSIQGSDRYYAGTENANSVVTGRYRTTYRKEVFVNNETDVAYVLFREWMHSDGHRRAMLVASADEAALGVAKSEGKIYAALELC